MMVDELADELEDLTAPSSNGASEAAPPADGWTPDKNGKPYVARQGRPGIIYRQGDETVEQARARDAEPKGDKRPRRKTKPPKMPDPPRQVDLKALEVTIADALTSPAMICASFGDEWAADHFAKSGPYLARNLVNASNHNPWLRKKLEEAATGQDAMMKMVSLMGVGGALFGYAIPPIIYWFNLPAPQKTREMFGIPDRREREPEYAAGASQPEPEIPLAA